MRFVTRGNGAYLVDHERTKPEAFMSGWSCLVPSETAGPSRIADSDCQKLSTKVYMCLPAAFYIYAIWPTHQQLGEVHTHSKYTDDSVALDLMFLCAPQCNGTHSWQGNLDLMVFLCNNLLTLVALLFAVWLEVCLPCIRQFELWLMKGYVGINISLGSCLISRPQAYAATHLGLSWRPRLAKSGWRLDWFMLLAWFLILGNWSTQACSQH